MIDQEEQIHLNNMSDEEAQAMCAGLRERIINVVSRNGGHLASNLGTVELTIALHRVFDTSRDRLVFDVGHQCYTHKLLTGRDAAMDTLRTFGGLSGYPKPAESAHDAFVAGHASNSVSAALGMARARTILKEDYSVIALIGDGALTGGLAYEGLSDAGQSGEPLIVILNDNGMSITKNVGGVAQHLAHQRLKPQYLQFKKGYRKAMSVLPLGKYVYRFTHNVKKVVKEVLLPCSMFEDMGFVYLGPVDGHDLKGLTRLLRYARDLHCPVMLHIRTVKGKGYAPAEQNPDAFHGVSPFHVETGEPLNPSKPCFSTVFGTAMVQLAEQDSTVCAVTAAMQPGTGLEQFSKRFPERFFDVGIAEGHAVTMAAGMAKQGLVPVFAVYSTFLQRGYDMLIHDVGIQGLHVVFAVDRAGLVGEDGETHHGLFDVAYLNTVPGMTILCPANFSELRAMLEYAVHEVKGPVAVRYPRGGEESYRDNAGLTGASVLREGADITLIGYGTMTGTILRTAEKLADEGISCEVIKLNSINPLDWDCVLHSVGKTGRLLIAEECVSMGSVGERIAAKLPQAGVMLHGLALCDCGNRFMPHGGTQQLRKLAGLDEEHLYRKALEVLHGD